MTQTGIDTARDDFDNLPTIDHNYDLISVYSQNAGFEYEHDSFTDIDRDLMCAHGSPPGADRTAHRHLGFPTMSFNSASQNPQQMTVDDQNPLATQLSLSELQMPASFNNLAGPCSPSTMVAHEYTTPAWTRTPTSTSLVLNPSPNYSGLPPSSGSQIQANAGTSGYLQSLSSPKILHLNFAVTHVDAAGDIMVTQRDTLRNVQGFPVDLEEAKSIPALDSILLAFFPETLRYYGLTLNHLSGYAAVFHSEGTDSYYTMGPAGTHKDWRKVFDHLVSRTPAHDHCLEGKCEACRNPPQLLACFDEYALSNALISSNINPKVEMEYLDGQTLALNTKMNRSGDALGAAYGYLQCQAAQGPLVQALTVDFTEGAADT